MFTESGNLLFRVLWCSALLIGLIVLLYTLVIQITRFLQYKVEISITHVDQPRLVFPAVTLCNHNQFRRSVASQSPEMSHRLHTLFSGKYPRGMWKFPWRLYFKMHPIYIHNLLLKVKQLLTGLIIIVLK